MRKEILILTSTITIEVDEGVELCDNFKDAIKGGHAKFIKVDVGLSTESGMVCEDKDVLEEARQAIIYGLEERG